MVGLLDWLSATITQGFGPTNEVLDGPYNGYAHFNKGYDFGVDNQPIGANISGLVVGISNDSSNPNGWGKSVAIKDDNGNIHHYSHLSAINVGMGQSIEYGQQIGVSGNTGASTGPHLSYDVEDATGQFIDPTDFLLPGTTNPSNGGGGGFDLPLGLPSIPNPLDEIQSGFGKLAAPLQKIAEVFIWVLDPHHWFRVFFILAGTGMIGLGMYIYFRGSQGVESDVTNAAKAAAIGGA